MVGLIINLDTDNPETLAFWSKSQEWRIYNRVDREASENRSRDTSGEE